MEDSNWIYMLESMQSIRYFSRVMIQRATKEYQMPAEHLELLSRLAVSNEKMTPMTLSKLMKVNKTIISRIIDKLNNIGYLIKTKDENDKRSYFVSITELGEEQLKNIYKHYLGPIYELRRKLGEKDFSQLMACIEEANVKMNDHVEGI
ncbi:MarR family winged helix-turn-helix transcriptional regulator [Clostridium algidicarnis]|nr:MarR family winged helix-turn-helix transcriptional regulator [Clostridium algidicarnis]MBB6631470.1 winged helix-turn-helix transcriptional regulator [Clostridium algidicarnis]MBB6697897.1 winged helix-turn-helix transcriptional regulator [Clostridium algidicarnis]MBU3196264.1 MarR family winged helix-turn-helix transcriptional regulator [Clostridium algidicarnis]MBU3207196.1 MarR family winged helix-turn-helix transcriptional regulator [Clostridium algidicarnis]MBU3209403.1 MarR family wi